MPVKTNRIQSTSEMIRRRFHADVRGLKRKCEQNNIALFTYYNAKDSDICILSSDEYEIGSGRIDCSPENENYFVSENDYLILTAE